MKTKHGGHGTLTYARWKSMMARCNNPNASNFKYYGALGVTVCERWHDFASFRTDMGECPSVSMTLDRLKNELGYEPGNCRWATQAEQNRNRSHCVPITHDGSTRNLADWSPIVGISANVLALRLKRGWSAERALTTPANASRNTHPTLVELTHASETLTVLAWAARLGMTPNAIRMRLRLGWSVDRALTTPVKR